MLVRSWFTYWQSPPFRERLGFFQKAIAKDDIDAVTARLRSRAVAQATERATASVASTLRTVAGTSRSAPWT